MSVDPPVVGRGRRPAWWMLASAVVVAAAVLVGVTPAILAAVALGVWVAVLMVRRPSWRVPLVVAILLLGASVAAAVAIGLSTAQTTSTPDVGVTLTPG